MSCESSISVEELRDFVFSKTDAILVTDRTQVRFLSSTANSSLQQCQIVPFSVHAYTAAIREQLPVQTYFPFIDFPECKRQYQKTAETLSRTWLSELGLKCEVEGLDLVQFDAPNQFLLFGLASYLENTASRIVQALRHVNTFYVVSAEQPLPLDFYFDSDVPASLLRATCERLGRRVRQITFENRELTFSYFNQRPMTKSGRNACSPRTENLSVDDDLVRVGFAPATVVNYQQIADALNELEWPTVLFHSIWGKPPMFLRNIQAEYRLSDGEFEDTEKSAVVLQELWAEIKKRRSRSSLPPALKEGPYLDYQLEYVVTRRWLSYRNLIQMARRLTSKVPLDLFIHSETFTAEGAILAHFYREAGTPVLVAPHSRWPCDSNWSTRRPSDVSLVFSREAAKRLKLQSRASKTFIVRPTPAPNYRSLLHSPMSNDLVEGRKRLIGNRKVIVLVTNALELLCVPFVNLQQHLKTVSFIGRTLQSEQDRILLAVRTKPEPLGEDPVLYQQLCGIPEASVTFLKNLSFSECLDLADCVLGVNIPTNGYFEVLERGVPLVHVQTTEAVTLHPDLPMPVLCGVTAEQTIWPTLERILFDPGCRTNVLQRQSAFLENDQRETYIRSGRSVKQVLEKLSRNQRLLPWSSLRRAKPDKRMAIGTSQSMCPRTFTLSAQGRGSVDDIQAGSDNSIAILGWAADLTIYQPAKRVHIFLENVRVASGLPSLSRPDVAQVLGRAETGYSGFAMRIPNCSAEQALSLEFFAELGDGTFYQLKNPLAR